MPDATTLELTSAIEAVSRLVIRMPSSTPMTLTTAATLTRLERSGPIRLSELASAEGTTQPTMTQLVTRLENDGLATRNPDPDDGRAVLVAITPAGSRAVAERRDERAARLLELIGRLPLHEQRRLREASGALSRLARLGNA
jgi:DNA-binding MarR family transcriptional regulator